MQPMTDRFRFWYANLAFIDRSLLCSSLAQEKVVFSHMTDGGWLWNGCKLTSFPRKMSVTFSDWLVGHRLTPFLKSTVCDNSNPGLRSEACMKSTIWEPHFALSENTEFIQGHPTSAGVFCKISVRRSNYCLEFSIIWGRRKISRWSFYLCKIFDAYLTNSLRFSEV